MDGTANDPVEGEVRLSIEGGVAHFPGLAQERVVRFCDIPSESVDALVRCAEDADFFDQPAGQVTSRPDARTYTICLTIGTRSHKARIPEPIANPALAKLVSTIRQVVR